MQSHLKTAHGIVEKKDEGLTSAAPLTDAQKDRVVEALTKWIAVDYRPLNIVEGVGFQQMFKIIRADFGKPPCANTIGRKIAILHDVVRAGIVQELSEVSSIALTTDGWTSRSGRHYMGVTAHWITDEWTLASAVLGVKTSRGVLQCFFHSFISHGWLCAYSCLQDLKSLRLSAAQ